MVRKIKQYTNPFIKVRQSHVTPESSARSDIQVAIDFHLQGNLVQAEAIYRQVLKIEPSNADALHLLGLIAHQTGYHQAALDLIGQAIEVIPTKEIFYSSRGVVLKKLKQLDAAIISYKMAIELNPKYAEAYSNLGSAQAEQKQLEAAVISYKKAIELKPDLAEAYSNLGIAQAEQKQLDAAVISYKKAIELKPDLAETYSNLGIAQEEQKHLDAAVISYKKAIELKADYANAYSNLGNAQLKLKELEAAVGSYEKAIELNPDFEYLYGNIHHAKMNICDWQDFNTTTLEFENKIQKKIKVSNPFSVLALLSSPAYLRLVSEIWSQDKYPFNPSLGPIHKSSGQSKIRIAYFSADFRLHPVALLTIGMFEYHDKSKFELIAFSFGPESQDEIRERITIAFDKFIDVSAMSDKEVAVLSRKLKVDIAIDLGGHTQDCRTGIFAFRAAPIQLSYIGYLGSMGAEYYDYLIADRTIIPFNSQKYYSEKIVYLPNYQVNDSKQAIPHSALSRQELNLPNSGFVYCCFNANYKITPPKFDGWMRILKAVPESVLMLYTDTQTAAINLKLEAQKRGVNPERLIFGEKLIRTQYLARCRSADLFLDTLPYNAGATASDALWAGLPVLTCMGDSFASRYAASMLFAIALPELVAETQTEYEALAIELATNPIKLKSIKDKLENNRLTTSLFDTAHFTKHIEAAYTKMYEKYQADLPPDHIYINDENTKEKLKIV
jgi:predicted O-linked N-acetylglucosamine transferase (SPINDLY family)